MDVIGKLAIGKKEKNEKHYRLSPDDKNGIKLSAQSSNISTTPNCTTTIVYAVTEEDRVVVGYVNEWINAYSFITSEYLHLINSEKTISKQSIDLHLSHYKFPKHSVCIIQ